MKIINAKCPNCGANLDISNKTEKIKCDYCNQTLLIDDGTIRIEGNISVDGIETDDELLTSANELLNMNEYLKAKKKFLEYSEKNPDNYQGWLGLLICRTRNFTIKDNNIMFGIDVNKYYEHFLRVAPEEIKNKYVEIIENYLNPSIVKEVKKIKEKKININKKYIAPVILILIGLASIINSSIIGGLLWILSGTVVIPQLRDKMNLSLKKSIIFSVIFGISGLIAVAINYPTDIEGTWTTLDGNLKIEFQTSNNVKIKHSNGTTIIGTYKSKNSRYGYIITITDNNSNTYVLKYNPAGEQNKKLCTYKNEECLNYFKDKDL